MRKVPMSRERERERERNIRMMIVKIINGATNQLKSLFSNSVASIANGSRQREFNSERVQVTFHENASHLSQISPIRK